MHLRLTALSLAAAFVATTALAQDNAPPARNGDIYNGTAHEPNAGVVTQQEKAAGIGLPPAQSRAANNRVEQLDKNIQDNGANTVGPAKSLACTTVPATCK